MLAQSHARNATMPIVTALLAVAIVLGSATLWIGIPLLGLWLAGELTTTAQGFHFAVLGGIPLAMTAFAWVLYRVNEVYERARSPEQTRRDWRARASRSGRRRSRRRLRGRC